MSVFVGAPPSPYKGLAPFEDSDLDALLFFGRERESEVIAANLMASRITVLYGPSGVGKSSVLRAGVAHRLRREQEVEVAVFSTWTGDPVKSLIEAVAGSGDSLADALGEAASYAGGDIYLILDQFEECFLYHRRGGRFATELAEVVCRPGLRVNVLLGMREDSLARLDALKASIPNLLANRLRLERLDRAAGTAAIIGPITRYNELVAPDERVEVEVELEDTILDEVTAGRVDLGIAGRGVAVGGADENRIEAPYLQLVLSRLWDVEAERGSRVLRLATLRELGGAEHIVEDHLERAMAEFSPREKRAAAAMYNFLVTPSGTKIAHGLRDLAGYASVQEEEASKVLQRLTAERIVRASSSNGPTTTRYEIFHDVLADAVVAWRSRFEAERGLVEERVRHERRQRRLIAIGAAALLGLAVMAAIAVYAFTQRSEARHQAAAAKAAQVTAENLAAVADKARANERKAKKKAQGNERRAERAAAHSRQEERRANNALASERRARDRAEVAEAHANTETRHANEQTRIAQRQTRKATLAQARTNRQKKILRARELEASARALLTDDPATSVGQSLAAVAAFRMAGLKTPVPAEDTLREGLLAMRLKAVLRVGGPVRVVRFSPDGSLVLLAGKTGARLYDRAHGYSMRRLLPASNIADAAFSPDGRMVAAAGTGRDHEAHVWDVSTGAQLFALKHDGGVLSVAFSPDGRFIATGSTDGTARVWGTDDGLPRGEPFNHQTGARGDDVQMVSFSPDSTRLLTVGGNRFARLFDVIRHVELLPEKFNNVAVVNSAQFSHDGKLIATAGATELVRVWDASTGQLRHSMEGTGRVSDLAFSPDDRLLATAGSNDTIARVWDIAKENSVAILTMHKSRVDSVTFSPDGQSIVTTGRDGKAYMSGTGAGFSQGLLNGHRGPVNGATFSPGGDLVATWSEDGSARLWRADVGPFGGFPPADAGELGTHNLPPSARRGPSVAFSPDGRRVLSAGADGTARLWGPGRRLRILRHDGPVNSGSFSADGKTVITASDDGTARVWRVSDGRLLASLPQGAPVNVARLDRSGHIAVTAGRDGWALLWNVRTRSVLRRLKYEGAVNDAEFSRDGRLVVTAGADGTATIWRLSGARNVVLRGHTDEVVAAAFSPDGKRVATASADFTARIWNVRTGESRELSGHTGALTSLAFSRDGSRLVTGSTDSDARVWDERSGAEVAVLRIHSGAVTDVAFSADGRWVATAGPLAAGVWETKKRGVWPDRPIYLVRGSAAPLSARALDTVAFSPRGWRLVTGWRVGDVRTFNCRLCGGIKQLTAIGRARLHEIVHSKPKP
jgi:WD40 repeat protein